MDSQSIFTLNLNLIDITFAIEFDLRIKYWSEIRWKRLCVKVLKNLRSSDVAVDIYMYGFLFMTTQTTEFLYWVLAKRS